MKLLRLQARNFRCFEQLDLDLDVDGLVAVVGDNGAGKSTIFAAVEWGLYGGRGALPARRDGCPDNAECWVEVHFKVGGHAYGVRRLDGKTAELFDLPGLEKICTGLDSTSRNVATLLGLTRDMFRGTFYARQREVQALDSDEAKRRAQVELLLGIERLRRATAHAQTAAKEQRHVVAAMEVGAPDLDALRAEAERLAQAASDEPVTQAHAALARSKQMREHAQTRLEAVRAQERKMIESRGEAQVGASEAQQQLAAVHALAEQVAEAQAAQEELVMLTPAAGRVEALTGAEREMDLKRANHDRVGELREREHQALAVAAGVADQLAELRSRPVAAHPRDGAEDVNGGDLQAQVEAAEEHIEALRQALRELSDKHQTVDRRTEQTRARIARGERAAELDVKLAELPDAERAVAVAINEWHALTAKRGQIDEAITHDTEHRDAVLAGEKQAACPTCKRDYDDGELDEILAGYERDLQSARKQLAALDHELAEREHSDGRLRQRVEQLRGLAADRRALTDAPGASELATLRMQLEADVADTEQVGAQRESLEARLNDLVARLPRLRTQAREVAERLQTIKALDAQREQAEREARVAAEDLRSLGVNGYEAEAHTRLRTELAAAHAASHRCAELRGKADGLELLQRRLEKHRDIADAAEKRRAELETALAQVTIDPATLSEAVEDSKRADREVDTAHAALLEADRQATLDSEALAAANARLRAARRQSAQLHEQRSELRIRGEVADALGAFREDASRRARPTLEHETGLLLGQTTRQRYNSVQLTASYQLDIVDGDQVHPLRRFSGGEQDLAGLCLRLALSRTLARQRGAETGFVLLDEVFGSQDPDRRSALLEQLHAITESEFRQVFVISHTDDVVKHCDLRIDVARGEGGASIAVGPRR